MRLALEVFVLLGRYKLHEVMAKNQRGSLYRAILVGEAGFERSATLVTLDGHSDPALAAHFVSSTKAAALLGHPCIPRVFDLGCDDGRYFYAREDVDGVSLTSLLEKLARLGEAVPIEIALYLGLRIAEAIGHAHQSGVGAIHRSLSTDRIVVSQHGEVKVTGFGGEALLGGGPTPGGRRAPEILAGHDHDKRSNVFDIATIISRLVASQPMPTELAAILSRACCSNREVRHPSGGALFTSLRSFVNENGLVTSATRLGRWIAETQSPNGEPAIASAASELSSEEERRSPQSSPATFPNAVTVQAELGELVPFMYTPPKTAPPVGEPRRRMARGSSSADEPRLPLLPPPPAVIAVQEPSRWPTTLVLLAGSLLLFAVSLTLTIALN